MQKQRTADLDRINPVNSERQPGVMKHKSTTDVASVWWDVLIWLQQAGPDVASGIVRRRLE